MCSVPDTDVLSNHRTAKRTGLSIMPRNIAARAGIAICAPKNSPGRRMAHLILTSPSRREGRGPPRRAAGPVFRKHGSAKFRLVWSAGALLEAVAAKEPATRADQIFTVEGNLPLWLPAGMLKQRPICFWLLRH